MKTYRGYYQHNTRDRWRVTVQEEGKEEKPLEHVSFHSPDGFAWGYSGSGPADLALSLLCDLFGEHPSSKTIGRTQAWRLHQTFKAAVIAPLNMKSGWVFTEARLREILDRMPREKSVYR